MAVLKREEEKGVTKREHQNESWKWGETARITGKEYRDHIKARGANADSDGGKTARTRFLSKLFKGLGMVLH